MDIKTTERRRLRNQLFDDYNIPQEIRDKFSLSEEEKEHVVSKGYADVHAELQDGVEVCKEIRS